MRTSTKVLAAAGVAAVVATGGTAFTASNTVPASVAGYGDNTVSGTTVSNIAYSTVAGDASKLASVAFTSTTDVTAKTAQLTLKTDAAQVGTSPYACSLGTWDSTNLQMTITCSTDDTPSLSSFDTVGLTVTQ